MNKTELIAAVAENAGFTKKDTAVTVDAIITVITEALTNGEEVKISNFGTFATTERAAREGRNPKDGTPISIPASKAVKFKASSALKTTVKGE